MRRTVISLAAAGSSAPIILDRGLNPFSVGLGLVVTGAATSKVEHTFDDPFGTITTWLSHASLVDKTVGSYDGNYAYPVTAIRITQASTGTTTLTVLQAG
jgi:hypothetical protein